MRRLLAAKCRRVKPKELLCVCGYIVLSVFIFGCVRTFLASTRSSKPLLNIVFTVGGDCLVAHEGQDASSHEKERIGALHFFLPGLMVHGVLQVMHALCTVV